MMELTGQNLLILGLGREGVSLARHLTAEGAHVTVTDRASSDRLAPRVAELSGSSVRLVLGGEFPELVRDAGALFVSPGVAETNPVYQAARERGLPIESMTTLFFQRCPGHIIGITGSSGKTTTTGLIGHILRTAGRDVVVGGNIGDPMLDLLPRIGPKTQVVLELSSFQLSLTRQSPHLAVVTNISPNHLDRHGTMQDYIDAKRQIVAYQTADNWAVLNADDPVVRDFTGSTPAQIRQFGVSGQVPEGAEVRDGRVGLVHDGRFDPVMPCDQIPLRGRHNVSNVLAALATTDIMGVRPAAMAEAIHTFRPAPHRLQTVGRWQGITYIDDSIATSPERTRVALEAIDAPVILIAGGRDKHLPWDDLAGRIARQVRALLLIGEAGDLIEAAVRDRLSDGNLAPEAIYRCVSLPEAVTLAGRLAGDGEVVLLSPGCTSYDMFRDFEERGNAFARAVEELYAS